MKIHLISLGCPKNTVDTEVMLGHLLQAGHEVATDPARADIIVINTCGFIQSAKEESLDAIMAALDLKRNRPHLRVVAAGCLTQRYRAELAREIPELDAILGVNELPGIVAAVRGDAPAAPEPPLYLYGHDTPRRRITPGHYAYIKVSEGCSRSCSFCAIPAIRGPFRSRPPADILAEADNLLAEGVRELILIGQDTTAYGGDLADPATISALLRALDSRPGDFWIRLMYAYPTGITDELLSVMAGGIHICPYLDIPLQHSHPDILRRMGRPGSGERFLALLAEIRRMIPECTLRTSLIVGFPGETETHFRHLEDFVRAARFDHLGVFTYSDEEQTAAFALRPKVSVRSAEDRRRRLMEVQAAWLAEQARQRIGHKYPAIVDGWSREAEFLIEARTPGQAPDIDSVIYCTRGDLEGLRPGDFITVRLQEYVGYDYTAAVGR
ncbi:MAG: 30S ribosomal protein S12 methylthiotransferase RimO [Acidobacteria bacterium]|nr:30S ribosomal protein S12 methylthiotransferase RimO [Acidobacteriota bacterium]